MLGRISPGFSNDWKNIATLFESEGLQMVDAGEKVPGVKRFRFPAGGHGWDLGFASALTVSFMNRWLFRAFRYALALASTISVLAALADT